MTFYFMKLCNKSSDLYGISKKQYSYTILQKLLEVEYFAVAELNCNSLETLVVA